MKKVSFYAWSVLLMTIVNITWASEEADFLDRMINFRQESLSEMEKFSKKEGPSEVKELNEKMIKAEKSDLEKLLSLKKELGAETKVKKEDEFTTLRKKLENEIQRLQVETTRLFSRYHRITLNHMAPLGDFPKLEVRDEKNNYEVSAEVPGIAQDNIKVKVVKNDLIIEGERKSEIAREKKGEISSEFSYGEFQRTIHLDEKVDPLSLKTSFKDGILQVHLNKVKI